MIPINPMPEKEPNVIGILYYWNYSKRFDNLAQLHKGLTIWSNHLKNERDENNLIDQVHKFHKKLELFRRLIEGYYQDLVFKKQQEYGLTNPDIT